MDSTGGAEKAEAVARLNLRLAYLRRAYAYSRERLKLYRAYGYGEREPARFHEATLAYVAGRGAALRREIDLLEQGRAPEPVTRPPFVAERSTILRRFLDGAAALPASRKAA